MLKTVNRYLLRLNGSFFVSKRLAWQILAGNCVSLLEAQCSVRLYNNTLVVFSTEYCTFSQQYCAIWKCHSYAVLMNHRGMYQTPKRYEMLFICSVNEPQRDVSTTKGYTCTVWDVSHIHAHFSLYFREFWIACFVFVIHVIINKRLDRLQTLKLSRKF